MGNRLSRIMGVTSTMRKMEGMAHAELTARRDEEELARARTKMAHASAAATRAESGSMATFLASRQRAALAADAVTLCVSLEAEAAQATAAARELLVEAKSRTGAFERLAEKAREQALAALDAADAAVVDDMVAARSARLRGIDA